uniref:Uncharacterized protein n=1 Tax=Anopheles culicifacies TaxID=139723 RepID=A0A182MW36_9DIPT
MFDVLRYSFGCPSVGRLRCGRTTFTVVVRTGIRLVPASFRCFVGHVRVPVAYYSAPLDGITQRYHLRRRDGFMPPAQSTTALIAALPLPAASLSSRLKNGNTATAEPFFAFVGPCPSSDEQDEFCCDDCDEEVEEDRELAGQLRQAAACNVARYVAKLFVGSA